MKPAGWYAPSNGACLDRKLRERAGFWREMFTVKLFTAAQVAIAVKEVGLSDKTADRLRAELEK